jgi:N-acetylglucosaminyl-diphospho-decaprenol L-rhamnosyltransferase
MVGNSFPGVGLIKSDTNLGFGRAMNELAQRSTADYLMLLNSDVVVSTDLASPLIAALDAFPDAVAAGPRLVSPDGQVQYSANELPSLGYEVAKVIRGTRLGRLARRLLDADAVVDQVHRTARIRAAGAAWESEFVWATCWLMRRSTVKELGLFDESFPLYDEDLDFCVRAKARGRTVVYVPGVELVHLGGASSTAAVKSASMIAARRHYYEIHHGRWAARRFDAYLRVLPAVVALVAAIPRPRSWRPS